LVKITSWERDTNSLDDKTQMSGLARLRHCNFLSRQNQDDTLVRIKTVWRPRCRDQKHIPACMTDIDSPTAGWHGGRRYFRVWAKDAFFHCLLCCLQCSVNPLKNI